jgi:transglutaminase-like putative cysteine protease
VENILKWLQANMKYELDRSDELAEILRTRRGGCHQYSNLMVTICRACGVPAVVAHGCALPKSGAFTDHAASHGWVEVYLNRLGWVPVEPLNTNSLRAFEASVYLIFATSCHTPTDDRFGYWAAQKYPITGWMSASEPA